MPVAKYLEECPYARGQKGGRMWCKMKGQPRQGGHVKEFCLLLFSNRKPLSFKGKGMVTSYLCLGKMALAALKIMN